MFDQARQDPLVAARETRRSEPDLSRVVCAGDGFLARVGGASVVLENLCRVEQPELPWRFWHSGEANMTAARLRAEAVWRVLGHGGGRVLVSLGQAELLHENFVAARVAAEIRDCLHLLADKSHGKVWYLLPIPSLWPLERRPWVQALRLEMSETAVPWTLLDLEPYAAAYVAAQEAHPDNAAALVNAGPSLTDLGALMVALEIQKSWARR